jgi:hypothetical protein
VGDVGGAMFLPRLRLFPFKLGDNGELFELFCFGDWFESVVNGKVKTLLAGRGEMDGGSGLGLMGAEGHLTSRLVALKKEISSDGFRFGGGGRVFAFLSDELFLLAKIAFAIDKLFLPLGSKGGEILGVEGLPHFSGVVNKLDDEGGEVVESLDEDDELEGFGGRAGLFCGEIEEK